MKLHMKEPTLSEKFWIHSDGKVVNIPYEHSPIPEDHTAFVAQNPHLFGYAEKDLSDAIGSKEFEKAKKIAVHHDLQKHMESNGWTRVTNSIDKFDDGTVQRTINIDRNHIGAHPDEYIEPLKSLKPYIDEQRSKGEEVLIGLHGIHKPNEVLPDWLKSKGLTHRSGQTMIAIPNENIFNKIIGESGGKLSRTPSREQSVPTPTQVQAAAGEKPADMPDFMWKRMFNLGDSYKPSLVGFKKFIRENKLR